jgi:hypothetical protein
MPEGRAIFFPILEKEDSFAEDIHLSKEEELIERAKNSTDKVICMEAAIDGESVRFDHLENFRARSQVFDLVFPENNVYDVKAGPTRSVCDGFWLFIKPLTNGPHTLYFKGETMLAEPYIEDHMKRTEAYSNIRSHIFKNRSFILDVSYELTILSSG